MLQSVNDLKGYDIFATDGEIGNIEEFYFEDINFKMRYLVANTGNWLTGKQNLISPVRITHLDRENRRVRVSLTKEEVRKSPTVDKHLPVSRQMEKMVSDYYGNTYYWDDRPDLNATQLATVNAARATVKSAMTTTSVVSAESPQDVHLRSAQETAAYEVAGLDGTFGKIVDFIVETDNWTMRYVTVDTGSWLAEKQVLVSTGWIEGFNWSNRRVNMNLTRAQIESCPDFNEVAEITNEYETRLQKHFDGNP